MPPKKPTVASKRKAKDESESSLSSAGESEEVEDKPTKAKKARAPPKPKEPVKPLDASLPTNLTLPESMEYSRPAEGVTRLSAWNITSVNSSLKKGMLRYIEAEDADLLILTETKCADPKIKELEERYSYRYWGVDPKKGYAGTAVLSKIEPLSVVMGMGETEEERTTSAGRVVTLEFANSFVVGTYVQNAGAKLANMDKKEAYNAAFERHLRALDARGKAIIWGGDLNVVPEERDIRNWKTNYNKSAGCTDTEIQGYKSQLNPAEGKGTPMKDAWRELHPDVVGHYSYYSVKFQCRTKGIGWRLDSFVVSEPLVSKVKQCEIRQEVWGASDHVPVILDIEGPL